MRNKRKGILMASAILGSAAIVSTGFAAWVVSTNVTETATGNIEVDTVNDERIVFEQKPTFVDSDDTISFGAPSNMKIANAWLTNNSAAAKYEDKDVTFTFKVKWTADKYNSRTEKKNIVLYYTEEINGMGSGTTFESLNTYTPKYKASDEANTLNLLKVDSKNNPITLTVTGATLDKSNKTITCEPGVAVSVKVAFDWGTAFGGQNPYNYFNSDAYTTVASPNNDAINEAIARLEALATKIEPLGFSYTITNKNPNPAV